jgi:hypothetical protein
MKMSCCKDCKKFINPPPGSKYYGSNKGSCAYYRVLWEQGLIEGFEVMILCYPDRDRDASNCKQFESNYKQKGGCFITTAVCQSMGKADDCYELELLRNYRDTYLRVQCDGESLISEYYEVAPKICTKIDTLPDNTTIYSSIYRQYILPCVKLIEKQEYDECKNTYSIMVNTLKQAYLS